MRALVFDLRGNGGGSEQEAVNIVNMFVPKGKLIVSNRGRLKQGDRDYKTTVEPIDSVMPVVVLVDDDTASSSEITRPRPRSNSRYTHVREGPCADDHGTTL